MNITKKQVKENIELELKVTKKVIKNGSERTDIKFSDKLDIIYRNLRHFEGYLFALKDLNLISEKEFDLYYKEDVKKCADDCINNM